MENNDMNILKLVKEAMDFSQDENIHQSCVGKLNESFSYFLASDLIFWDKRELDIDAVYNEILWYEIMKDKIENKFKILQKEITDNDIYNLYDKIKKIKGFNYIPPSIIWFNLRFPFLMGDVVYEKYSETKNIITKEGNYYLGLDYSGLDNNYNVHGSPAYVSGFPDPKIILIDEKRKCEHVLCDSFKEYIEMIAK